MYQWIIETVELIYFFLVFYIHFLYISDVLVVIKQKFSTMTELNIYQIEDFEIDKLAKRNKHKTSNPNNIQILERRTNEQTIYLLLFFLYNNKYKNKNKNPITLYLPSDIPLSPSSSPFPPPSILLKLPLLHLYLRRLRLRVQLLRLIRQEVQPGLGQIRRIHQILHLPVGLLQLVLVNEPLDLVDRLVQVHLFQVQ